MKLPMRVYAVPTCSAQMGENDLLQQLSRCISAVKGCLPEHAPKETVPAHVGFLLFDWLASMTGNVNSPFHIIKLVHLRHIQHTVANGLLLWRKEMKEFNVRSRHIRGLGLQGILQAEQSDLPRLIAILHTEHLWRAQT